MSNLHSLGLIDKGSLKVIGKRTSEPHYPFDFSTSLSVPEWPLVALPHVSEVCIHSRDFAKPPQHMPSPLSVVVNHVKAENFLTRSHGHHHVNFLQEWKNAIVEALLALDRGSRAAQAGMDSCRRP